MPVETLDDRRTMIEDFGVEVSYVPLSGDSATFKGIFDNEHSLEDVGGSVAFSVVQPRLTCVTADVSAVVEGDVLRVPVDGSEIEYVIRVAMPDGTGITELQLEKQ
jgi:hypothetical protein